MLIMSPLQILSLMLFTVNMISGLTREKNRKNLWIKIYVEAIYFQEIFKNYYFVQHVFITVTIFFL